MPQRLLSILQISDLHIGRIDPVSGNALVSAAEAAICANFSWLDGVLGHHARGLQDLHEFYWKMVDEGEAPQVMMTGDLTRIANADDFTVAQDYLAAEIDLNPPHGDFRGLYSTDWTHFGIPGNHDHWSGRPVPWGGPNLDFHACFPANRFPFARRIALSNGRSLQVSGINTDSDVVPYGHKRTRAVGSFQSQLAAVGRIRRRMPEMRAQRRAVQRDRLCE